ncbi:hypothetical protein DGWBC_0710 [Dehalogenimonas sp. WBC-2]|nr:hypothetical protein DGWBC_0710 [Dehalogenimonas sp. WBC-2]
MENQAILILDETGCCIDCNTEAEKLLGATCGHFLGTTPERFSPAVQPDGQFSKDKASSFIQAAFEGTPQIFRWQHRKFDGTLFDTEVSLNRIEIGGKKVLLAIHRDITALKRAETARMESEQMFRSIVEYSHSGIFTIDDSFQVTYANDMVSLLLGLPIDQVVGHDFREFMDEESALTVVDMYYRRRRGESVPSRYEFNIINAQREKRRVEISSTLIQDISGNYKTVGQVLDITERKKAEAELRLTRESLEIRVIERTLELQLANTQLKEEILLRENVEQALRKSETKYRHLVESGNTIILEIDTTARVTFFNEFAQRFFGFTESEILGRSIIGTIVPPRDSANTDLDKMIQNLVNNPDEYRLNENENMRKNGERVWIVWTNQPIFMPVGS